MEEWKEYKTQKLGDYILDIAAGPFGSNLKVECFVPSGFPIIDGANLRGFKVTDNVTKFVTEEKARSLYRSIAKRNDVVVTISGNVGQISYIPYNSKYKEYLVSQRQFRATFDTTKVHVPYLIYYFHTIEGQHKILSFANQTGVPALAQPLKNFKNIDVQLPPLSKQKQIASILSSLDEKIECNKHINDNLPWVLWMTHLILLLFKRKNDNLEQQAQALFKSWFVDFEPFKDGEFVESELGMIPKGWKVGKLSEIADIKMGVSPSGTSYNTDGVGEVFYQGRAEFGFRFPKRNMYTTEAKRIAEADAVLVSVRAPVGDINVAEERCCIGRGLASVNSKHNCNSFILYLMQSLKPVFDRFNGEGTVFGSINKKAFEELQVLIPNKTTIVDYESIANSIDRRIKKTEQESCRLAQLRDTLLPRLMSGELKVN